MTCYNHPYAPTAATCNRCGVKMCGVCTQFLESGEYCEKCAEEVQAESFVTTQSQKFNKRKHGSTTYDIPEQPLETATSGKDRDKGIIILAIGGSVAMLFFSLLLYAFPRVFDFDADAAAAIATAQALEDCRLVFEEIGYLLDRGELPTPSYNCAESDVPNIMSQEGDLVRISHPNPEFHGLSEIYVTSDSHKVIFVELDNAEA